MDNRCLYNNDNKQSLIISWLRFPLIVMIVYIHSYGLPPENSHLPIIQSGLYEITRTVVSNMICQSAVPCFFFISGFLMFYKIEEWNTCIYLKKIQKRIYTLLIPYVAWNFIALCVWFARLIREGMSFFDAWSMYWNKGLLSGFWNMYYVGGATLDWFGGKTYMSGPADLPFWYLRDLIVVTLFSPIIYYCIRRLRVWWVAFLGLVFVSGVWQYPCSGFSTVAFFFYSAGAYFSITNTNFVALFRRYSSLAYFTYTILLFLLIIFPFLNVWFFPLFRLIGLFAIFGLADWFLRDTQIHYPSVCSDSSFFIYAVHYVFFLSFCDDIVEQVFPSSHELTHAIQYLLSPLIRINVYIGIFYIAKRFFPAMTSLLTGSRS